MQRLPHLARVFLLPFLLVSPWLAADTLWLENGDRVTGTIVDKTSARWRIDTDYAGEIEIDARRVERVALDEPPSPSVKAMNALGFAVQPKPPRPEPAGDDAAASPTERPFNATGGVDVAFEYEHSTADTRELELDLRQRLEVGAWRHKWQASYHREYRDGKRRENDWHLAYSPERFFSERHFWQGRVSTNRDWNEALERRFSVGVGPGYQLWDNERGAFSLSALLTRNRYQYADQPDDNFQTGVLQWQFNRYLWADLLELYANGRAGRALSQATSFLLDAETGMRYPLTDWASLQMSVETDWVENSAEDLSDTTYNVGIGLNW
ncbi:DUF481 domain-containing protein [Vreelandella subglaciescola]|jgi:hypothetical protein|uniref:Salt-induced outer membrane protein YdiY n=1 Tax=Vreelandella subglaciescola TaxID=29571 RepID=A0A1M7HHR6_9GAMM|nr:DUF481 domain-containing protein [Halomonas subglaciescola]SHM27978.1 Protein of unknown function, DUF481 [Halomonas subglaciescola]